jgi:hypothetical protein
MMMSLVKNMTQNMTIQIMMNLEQCHHQPPRHVMAASPDLLIVKRTPGPFLVNGLCENIEPDGEPCTRRFAQRRVLYLLRS